MNLKQQLKKLKREKFHGVPVLDFIKMLPISRRTYYLIISDNRGNKNSTRVINKDIQLQEAINELL